MQTRVKPVPFEISGEIRLFTYVNEIGFGGGHDLRQYVLMKFRLRNNNHYFKNVKIQN